MFEFEFEFSSSGLGRVGGRVARVRDGVVSNSNSSSSSSGGAPNSFGKSPEAPHSENLNHPNFEH